MRLIDYLFECIFCVVTNPNHSVNLTKGSLTYPNTFNPNSSLPIFLTILKSYRHEAAVGSLGAGICLEYEGLLNAMCDNR